MLLLVMDKVQHIHTISEQQSRISTRSTVNLLYVLNSNDNSNHCTKQSSIVKCEKSSVTIHYWHRWHQKNPRARVLQHNISLKYFSNYLTPPFHVHNLTQKGSKTQQGMCNKTESSQNIIGGTLKIQHHCGDVPCGQRAMRNMPYNLEYL